MIYQLANKMSRNKEFNWKNEVLDLMNKVMIGGKNEMQQKERSYMFFYKILLCIIQDTLIESTVVTPEED